MRASNANSIIKFLLPAFGRARVENIYTFVLSNMQRLLVVCLSACLFD